MCAAETAFKLEALVSARESAKKEQATVNEAAKIRSAEIEARRAQLRNSQSDENR